MKIIKNIQSVSGGAVYKHEVSFFVLSPGDNLVLPDFEISYPDAGGPSVSYTVNGKTINCNKQKEDNTWTSPSPISDSFFSKNNIVVQTDENYLYVEASYLTPYLPA
jgi:hypothetical protein